MTDTGPRTSLATLNRLDRDAFVEAVGFAFEGSPWIARSAWESRPWGSLDELVNSLWRAVETADVAAQEELLRAHPDLAGAELDEGRLTASSQAEQTGAGLHLLSVKERRRLHDLARRYRQKFGFPCVICVREHTPASILASTERRLGSTPGEERTTALGEVRKIALLRLRDVLATEAGREGGD